MPKAIYGGYTANGSFADYGLAPAAYVAPIPERLSDVDAAPILCARVTMWNALKETDVASGQWTAISGVGGWDNSEFSMRLPWGCTSLQSISTQTNAAGKTIGGRDYSRRTA